MDDETFKKEVLDRLQQIIEMLTSFLPEACVEEPEERGAIEENKVAGQASEAYSIGEEMQDSYRFAIEKWKQEHGGT